MSNNKPMEQLRRSKRLQQKNSTIDADGKQTENLIQQHPLLNEWVLENVFGYLKCQNKATTLAQYRTICKKWDSEIVKFFRKDTQIDLTKILAPYPDGMGWTASPENLETPFYYDIPYLNVRSFENVVIAASTCESVKNHKWADWFRIMGSQVKGLKLSSPFICFCQNRFLERILKDWCPNLVRLELCNVKCVERLLHVSSFSQNSKGFICKGLKKLNISVEGDESYSEIYEIYSSASALNIRVRKLYLDLRIDRLVDIRYENGRIRNSANQVIRKNVPVKVLDFVKRVGPTDGGIMGHLLNENYLEKIEISRIYRHANDLVTFFHIRPNNWRSSIKELELPENLSKSLKELHVIAQVKFPLSSIKLCGIHTLEWNEEMTRFLQYFADTLEHLEFSEPYVKQEIRSLPSKLSLPLLPKLKTFVHENITASGLKADNLWKNAPNLQKCFLKVGPVMVWNANKFFENTDTVLSQAMKELIAPVNSTQADFILSWFPNLSKLEVTLDSGAIFSDLFGKFEKINLEHLNVTLCGYVSQPSSTLQKCKGKEMFRKLSSIKGLKYLELNNRSTLPIRVTPKSFSKVGTLTSLKLTGFHIYFRDKEALVKNLSYIPAVNFINNTYLPNSAAGLKGNI